MAGRFTDVWLEELRSRLNIEEIVSEYVKLKPKGKRYWGLCPFHNEKTPSFSVDSESQMFYCFGCHKGGTVFNFVMDMERMEFYDSVKYLAERAHMSLPDSSNDVSSVYVSGEKDRIYEANLTAARYFHSLIWTSEGAEALKYLYGRGLNDRDIKRFGLGASPKGWDTLTKELLAQGFEREVLVKAGLTVQKESGAYDMFRDRVIFPIINPQGKVLGFGGRAMGDSQPKYLNTPDTPVFNKRNGLYALNMAKKERSIGHLVLVEGYMDVVSLRKYDVQGVVATLGTALTDEQTRLIKRYAPEIWISYDGDSAGQHAALRALDMLEKVDLITRVIDYPSGMDPDDFIKMNGKDGFDSLRKIDGYEYRMIRAKDGLDISTQDGMTQYALKCCAIIRDIKTPIEAENYLRRLVNETGYDREILIRQIGSMPKSEEPKLRRTVVQKDYSKRSPSEGTLIALLMRGLIPQNAVSPEDFDTPMYAECVKHITSGGNLASFVDSLDETSRAAIMTDINALALPEDSDKALEMAKELIANIHRTRKNALINELNEQLKTVDEAQKQELLARIAAILTDTRI